MLAYLILAHHKPGQLARLVQRLNTSNSLFFIYVDRKAHISDFLIDAKNVFYVKDRIAIHWGDYSQVQAALGLMRLARQYDCRYFIFLSGQDYPIKTNQFIHNFFDQNTKQFIAARSVISDWPQASVRFERFHFQKANQSVRKILPRLQFFLPKRKFFKHMVPYAGSSWWSLTRDCVDSILNFTATNQGYCNYFRYVGCPDELFFQTLIMNSPFKSDVINDDLRYVRWSACTAGKGNSPDILTRNDFDNVRESEKLFARKIDLNHDADIADLIDAELLQLKAECLKE